MLFLELTCFLVRSGETGMAKVEVAAMAMGLVSDQLSEPAAMMLLTESQEGSKATDELHCGCDGRLTRKR